MNLGNQATIVSFPALTSVVCESCDCESDGNTVDGSDDADNGSL